MKGDFKLSGSGLAILFVVGAVGGLIGDMCHVESGTTVYLEDPLPFIWKSQLWFPIMVGVGTASLGWISVRLSGASAEPKEDALREGATAITSVIALYALTALVRGEPGAPSVVLVYAVAALICLRFARSRVDLLCALLAALFGVSSEIVLSAADVFAYAGDVPSFAGVATWLPALYLAYGVVAARLGPVVAELTSRQLNGEQR